jgi:hypothetical protein
MCSVGYHSGRAKLCVPLCPAAKQNRFYIFKLQTKWCCAGPRDVMARAVRKIEDGIKYSFLL